MHYPWWYVPFLNAPMLIAAISVLHVLVSHYAVGGGLFLAVETSFARRTKNAGYMDYLHRHAWFFILITVVYGAITGVGIWWIIGLSSPLATETLIHAFVFGWGMEYVFFVLEIVSAFIFYYYWGRLDAKTHTAIGWIYAGAAWISLVLITGITAFMLHPGSWLQNHNFWAGFFNPQFVPQVLARTGGSLLLASLYVYLHAVFKVKDSAMRDMIAARSARPALLGSILIVLGGVGWLVFLPESARAALAAASTLNIMMAIIFALTIGVFLLLYFGPYKNPGWLSPGFAIVLFVMGLSAFSTGEFVREAVRKPFIVYNVVLGNQVLAEEVPALRANGYMEGGSWMKTRVSARFPQVMAGDRINEAKLLELPRENQIELGEMLFQYSCNNCHAAKNGFSPVSHLMRGWTTEMIRTVSREPEKMHFFMPPWAGTPEESELLAQYLISITPAHPAGMYFGAEK